MNGYTLLIAVTNTVTLLAGGLVALLAYRAFRRTDTLALRAVAVGFGFIVVGTAVGGLLHLGSAEVILGITVQSLFTAIGLLFIVYSIYTRTAPPPLSQIPG